MRSNDFFLHTKIRVGHRTNFRDIHSLNWTSFISGLRYFSANFYFRSRVLNYAADSTAHPREEKSFARPVTSHVLIQWARAFRSSVELNILENNQCLRFVLLTVTTFGNVEVSWRESFCWLSLLEKPILLDTLSWWLQWLAPKQALHTIRSGHIYHKELGVCSKKDQHLPSSGSCLSKAILCSLGRSSKAFRHTTGWCLVAVPRRWLGRMHYSAMYICRDWPVSRLELAVER